MGGDPQNVPPPLKGPALTFGGLGHGGAQAVHVVPPVAVVTEQQLVLGGGMGVIWSGFGVIWGVFGVRGCFGMVWGGFGVVSG